jgi:hypothetical protein
MKFKEYLWDLAHYPLKRLKKDDSDTFKFFKVVGQVLDELKEKIFLLRRQTIIATSKGKGLDKHGEDRKMPRYSEESDKQYQKRLLAKYEIAKMAGTKEGILKTLYNLGYDNAEWQPLFLTDPLRWAEFYVFIDQDRINELNNFEIVQREVRKIKQASSLPNYVFTYFQEFRIRSYIILGRSITRPACGTFKGKQKKFYKVVGYVNNSKIVMLNSMIIQQSNLMTCKSQLKTFRNGFKFLSNVSLETSFTYEYNSLRVCSKDTKTRRFVS